MTILRRTDGSVPAPRIEAPKPPPPPVVAKPVTKPAEVAPTKFTPAQEARRHTDQFMKGVDDKLKAAGVPDDVRARVMTHLKELQNAKGKAADPARKTLEAESRVIENALTGPNADRAIAAYDKINTVAAGSKEAAARLTPEIREALVNGVANRRTADDVGQEGVLGVKQAEEAAKAIATMPKEQYDALATSLKQAGQSGSASPRADAGAEKSLILKAVAARADRLADNPADNLAVKNGQAKETEAARAMKEITDFGADVRGLPRDELINTTTAIDVSSANTSTTDPYALRDAGKDTTTNNDGLYQRFEDTCGPTTSQLTRAEADPVFARKVNKEGIASADPAGEIAKEQKATLEKQRFYDANDIEVKPTDAQKAAYAASGTLPPGVSYAEKGNTSTRRSDQANEHLQDAMKKGGFSDYMTAAVNKKVNGQPLGWIEGIAANMGLKKLQAQDGGHPTNDEQGWIKNERVANHAGMQLAPALNDITSQSTHINYKTNWVGAGGVTDATLTGLDTRLKNGQDVPFRVTDAGNNGGHFMMISDVRGEGANKKYLVSDPYSGRTAWVDGADMKNKNSPWLKDKFGLGWTEISHTYTE
jgi:hypothetical protein